MGPYWPSREPDMDLSTLVILLVIAGLCGAIGASLAGHSHVGCLGSIALGFIGAMLGMWLARHMQLPEMFDLHVGTEQFPVFWSIVGSALFVGLLSFFTRPPRPF